MKGKVKHFFNKVGLGFKKIMNNRKILLIILGVVVLVIIVSAVLLFVFRDKGLFSATTNPDGEKFKTEYESLNGQKTEDGNTYPEVNLPSNNIVKYTDIDEVLKIFEERKNAVIYFGFPSCLYCRSAIEVLCDAASGTDLDAIYYLDAEDIWDVKKLDENNNVVTEKEANAKYSKLLEVLGDKFTEDYVLTSSNGEEISTGEKRLYTPLVIFVSHGLVVSYNKGTLFSQESAYTRLDKDQVAGLKEIYKYGIYDVLEIPQE